MLRVILGSRTVALRALSAAASASSTLPTSGKIDKEALMKLRRSTGYSFVNCRKALEKFGPSNLGEAEEWLRNLALKEGWTKAAKLRSRATTQGLVSVATDGEYAAIVELTCETDFVARGEAFQQLLSGLTSAVLSHAKKTEYTSDGHHIAVKELVFDSLTDSTGRALRDILTEAVGMLRENLVVRTIRAFKAPSGATLYASSHPKQVLGSSSVLAGRFASIVALRRLTETKVDIFPEEKLGQQICQHIIGMRTESLGTPSTTEAKEIDRKKENLEFKKEEDELNDFFAGQTTIVDENETRLLQQAFMLNPSQTVHEYLQGHEAEVIDFARIQLHGASEDD